VARIFGEIAIGNTLEESQVRILIKLNVFDCADFQIYSSKPAVIKLSRVFLVVGPLKQREKVPLNKSRINLTQIIT